MSKGRVSYTDDDDDAIIGCIERTVGLGAGGLSGNAFWRNLQRERITNHSWQSMRHRYLQNLKFKIERARLYSHTISDSVRPGTKSKYPRLDLVVADCKRDTVQSDDHCANNDGSIDSASDDSDDSFDELLISNASAGDALKCTPDLSIIIMEESSEDEKPIDKPDEERESSIAEINQSEQLNVVLPIDNADEERESSIAEINQSEHLNVVSPIDNADDERESSIAEINQSEQLNVVSPIRKQSLPEDFPEVLVDSTNIVILPLGEIDARKNGDISQKSKPENVSDVSNKRSETRTRLRESLMKNLKRTFASNSVHTSPCETQIGGPDVKRSLDETVDLMISYMGSLPYDRKLCKTALRAEMEEKRRKLAENLK